jgi:bifunctional UDP-N-acetylglucosamine pyrophosphorylase / glucosamine-1-phosphate N-acetyltransferase
VTADSRLAAIVLAAGQGTRMKSARPKVMHAIAGRPMIGHVLDRLAEIGADRIVVVLAPAMDEAASFADAAAPVTVAIQDPPRGTGHAVMAAHGALADFTGDVLVLYGDTPLIGKETIAAVVAARRAADNPAVVVLGFTPADPGAYGRLVRAADGELTKIVEARDATADERAIGLCNAGIMAFDGARLAPLLAEIGTDNAKREFYLTDAIEIARRKNWRCAVVEARDPDDVMGVNSRSELAQAESIMQRRLRAAAMTNGATLIDPDTVYFSHDTRLGRDVTIGPNVVFGPGVSVADGVEILAFSHLEQASVGAGARIGPFARLRPGAEIGADAHIGNFVEIKAAVVETGAKVNHLTYVGDARVGAGANVGAGTITCNYDGYNKSFTDIGADAFIGSNSALVAPVKIGDRAVVGAGSVVTRDVPADALVVTRAEEKQIAGGAAQYRERKAAEKKTKAAAKAKAHKSARHTAG